MLKLKPIFITVFQLMLDAFTVVISIIIGFRLYYGFGHNFGTNYFIERVLYIALCVAMVLICNALMGCYNNVWSRAGIGEFLRLTASNILYALLIVAININKSIGVPPEVISMVVILQLMFMMFFRVSIRFGRWILVRAAMLRKYKNMEHVIIYGAGEAGMHLLEKLQSHPEYNMRPVGFIDDNKGLWGKKILGISVLGGRDKLADSVKSENVQIVIIAIPTAGYETLREVLKSCHSLHCKLKRYGTIDDVNETNLKNAEISDINLEDLLRRDSVKLNMEAVTGFLKGKTVLVTGGAGSIGSEICRQVLGFGIKKLIVYDIFENGLYEINNELEKRFDHASYELVLGSVRDRRRLDEVFRLYKPQVIFHAAAHKHVPMMELNPKEAVKNNVFGTVNVAQEAILYGAEKFILISTDKAVNPVNIMGASKRIAEMVIQSFENLSDTEFAAVRFGNVLGSSGSVVPHFKKQIAEGGPVTVTHPDMRRYFMTIPEAVQLVLEAGAMAKGGEIFVLDMGKPVYIQEMARDLIRLSGLEPDKDIKIVFTGLRPGEKLFEEISLAEENVSRTQNNKIYICKPMEYNKVRLSQILKDLDAKISDIGKEELFKYVNELVPTFSHKE